eukprot:745917-Hanusia_phi.AAC.2
MAWWDVAVMLIGLRVRKMQRELRMAKMRIDELEKCALPPSPPPSPFPSLCTALTLPSPPMKQELLSAKEDSNPAMQICSPNGYLREDDSFVISVVPCDDQCCNMSESFVVGRREGNATKRLKLHHVLEPIIRHIEDYVNNMATICTEAKRSYQEQLQVTEQQCVRLERTCSDLAVQRDQALNERKSLENELMEQSKLIHELEVLSCDAMPELRVAQLKLEEQLAQKEYVEKFRGAEPGIAQLGPPCTPTESSSRFREEAVLHGLKMVEEESELRSKMRSCRDHSCFAGRRNSVERNTYLRKIRLLESELMEAEAQLESKVKHATRLLHPV